MPNWCQNVAYIDHEDKQKIDYMVDELGKKESQLFNSVMPRPAEEDENWYDWNVSNWGTKWDASVYDYHTDSDGQLYISFDTAWGPPIGFYQFLYENGYDVEAYYNEEGMAFAGQFIDGEDDFYNYGDMSADEIEETLPTKVDEMFNISQYQRDREDEESEEDEIVEPQYEMTDWFDKKIKPVHEGVYEVETESWPFPHKAYWKKEWLQYFGDQDPMYGLKVKVNKWRGLAKSEEEREQDLLKALEELKSEFEKLGE
jgi:hypothetical protein